MVGVLARRGIRRAGIRAQLLACLVVAVALTSAAAADTPCPGVNTVVVGHRGTGTDTDDNPFPENTIASFTQAVTEGATMIELDVQLSRDGVLVVMHDDTVNRTTDGTGCVAELDLVELQALNAGTETIPTLEEVFAAVDVDVNVEIKVADEGGPCPATDRRALAEELTMVLGTSAGDRTIVVSSFDFNQLLAVRSADPDVRLASLFVARDGFAPALAERMDAHPLVLAVRAIEVDAHHAAGLAVRPFTVNDEVTLERMLRLDVDGIVTDEPALLAATKTRICEAHVCPEDAGTPDAGDAGAGDAGVAADGGGCAAGGAGGGGAVWFVVACVVGSRRGRR